MTTCCTGGRVLDGKALVFSMSCVILHRYEEQTVRSLLSHPSAHRASKKPSAKCAARFASLPDMLVRRCLITTISRKSLEGNAKCVPKRLGRGGPAYPRNSTISNIASLESGSSSGGGGSSLTTSSSFRSALLRRRSASL